MQSQNNSSGRKFSGVFNLSSQQSVTMEGDQRSTVSHYHMEMSPSSTASFSQPMPGSSLLNPDKMFFMRGPANAKSGPDVQLMTSYPPRDSFHVLPARAQRPANIPSPSSRQSCLMVSSQSSKLPDIAQPQEHHKVLSMLMEESRSTSSSTLLMDGPRNSFLREESGAQQYIPVPNTVENIKNDSVKQNFHFLGTASPPVARPINTYLKGNKEDKNKESLRNVQPISTMESDDRVSQLCSPISRKDSYSSYLESLIANCDDSSFFRSHSRPTSVTSDLNTPSNLSDAAIGSISRPGILKSALKKPKSNDNEMFVQRELQETLDSGGHYKNKLTTIYQDGSSSSKNTTERYSDVSKLPQDLRMDSTTVDDTIEKIWHSIGMVAPSEIISNENKIGDDRDSPVYEIRESSLPTEYKTIYGNSMDSTTKPIYEVYEPLADKHALDYEHQIKKISDAPDIWHVLNEHRHPSNEQRRSRERRDLQYLEKARLEPDMKKKLFLMTKLALSKKKNDDLDSPKSKRRRTNERRSTSSSSYTSSSSSSSSSSFSSAEDRRRRKEKYHRDSLSYRKGTYRDYKEKQKSLRSSDNYKRSNRSPRSDDSRKRRRSRERRKFSKSSSSSSCDRRREKKSSYDQKRKDVLPTLRKETQRHDLSMSQTSSRDKNDKELKRDSRDRLSTRGVKEGTSVRKESENSSSYNESAKKPTSEPDMGDIYMQWLKKKEAADKSEDTLTDSKIDSSSANFREPGDRSSPFSRVFEEKSIVPTKSSEVRRIVLSKDLTESKRLISKFKEGSGTTSKGFTSAPAKDGKHFQSSTSGPISVPKRELNDKDLKIHQSPKFHEAHKYSASDMKGRRPSSPKGTSTKSAIENKTTALPEVKKSSPPCSVEKTINSSSSTVPAIKQEKGQTVIQKGPKFYSAYGKWVCTGCSKEFSYIPIYIDHLTRKTHLKVTEWDVSRRVSQQVPYSNLDEKLPESKGAEFLVTQQAFRCRLCQEYFTTKFEAILHLRSAEHNEKYKGLVEERKDYEQSLQVAFSEGKLPVFMKSVLNSLSPSTSTS